MEALVNNKYDDELLRYKLKTLLQTNILEVVFTKMDGTERVMHCTLDSTKMPELTVFAEETKKKPGVENLDVLKVWDVDKSAWRAFRIDRVNDFIVTRRKA